MKYYFLCRKKEEGDDEEHKLQDALSGAIV